MAKNIHEIRDAVHVFVRLDSDERKILDSRAFQRLRHIHQLALTHLVYPGATHRRFEHSLGVMELAERVFRIITDNDNLDDRVRKIIPPGDGTIYWRRVLRMAALCHDLGHLPFSHAAEKELLQDGRTHESVTVAIINSDEMQEIWRSSTIPLRAEDIAKLAVGPKELKGEQFTDWERILSEIIVGDSFGVDRMDYLLRDSLHAGVVYGKFDQYRLIDTLRILPESEEGPIAPVLGIEAGGLESAEGLLLARYFMYSQVYFHPVRRAYDFHLKDFMTAMFGDKGLPTEVSSFLDWSDNEVLVELSKAEKDTSHPGHDAADRIINRKHFRVLYERNPNDAKKNPKAGKAVYDAACSKFGEEYFRHDHYRQKDSCTSFPVRFRDQKIVSSLAASDVLRNLPLVNLDLVFVAPERRPHADTWLKEKRDEIIAQMENSEK
jgi:hypothetical protein